MTATRLTRTSYWDEGYAGQKSLELDLRDFRRFPERKIVEKIESLGLEQRKVLEVGAGNSAILAYLARAYANRASFTGLDYSEAGCEMLSRRAKQEGVGIEVVCQDLFDPSEELFGRFDVVYSLGVVEHFTVLPTVVSAMSKLLRRGGQLLTVIPNLAGVLGFFAKRLNRSIYDLHIPHNLDSLVRGHGAAGLVVESAGYLCSVNFGVVSSCFRSSSYRHRQAYMLLSRLTKLVWFVEDRIGDLPRSAALSPYIFVICRVPE